MLFSTNQNTTVPILIRQNRNRKYGTECWSIMTHLWNGSIRMIYFLLNLSQFNTTCSYNWSLKQVTQRMSISHFNLLSAYNRGRFTFIKSQLSSLFKIWFKLQAVYNISGISYGPYQKYKAKRPCSKVFTDVFQVSTYDIDWHM